MALQKNFKITKKNFLGELVAVNAYCKIESISGTKNSIQVEYKVYVEQEVVDQKFCNFQPDLNGKNFIAQAYEHLKTLPEFADAIDC